MNKSASYARASAQLKVMTVLNPASGGGLSCENGPAELLLLAPRIDSLANLLIDVFLIAGCLSC